MKIALMGTRGIPASYSGFETCVEQLGQRLVERGHHVTVYCRSHHITYQGTYFKGMQLVKLPTFANKYLDTIVHSFLSSFHALTQHYDVALYFNVGNSPTTWIPRIVGIKTVLNVDGLDWKREKWPFIVQKYLRFAEVLATKLPNAYITDSQVVQHYFHGRFDNKPVYIPYGSELDTVTLGETLTHFGLEPYRYILFVGRLEPENCAHHLTEAFLGLDTNLKCVIVGDAPYAKDYIDFLRTSAHVDPRVVFTGYVFSKGYQELSSNAYIFVETSGVGGTHPALLEAMAFGVCVVVHDTPENLETIGADGFAYDGKVGANSLRWVLQHLLSQPELVREYRQRAQQRAQTNYTWEAVTDSYEQLFYKLCS